ncbi:hypothetical protein ABDJ41_20255 [Pedobacter sp. ASV1-7]|uniref:hypothetical protein n=1 Tax=Pedobacter sp. ASV1-7 TaxID=3145237 RepID=UPI0032E86C87
MNKTIIAIYGRQAEGKSTTIKLAYEFLISRYPNAIFNPIVDFSGDILSTVELNGIRIGFESQGDPSSRIITQDTLRKLADKDFNIEMGGCDIIICATRTEGQTVKKVDEIASKFGYHTIWISSFWSPTLNEQVLNEKAANNILDIIISLIIGQI